MTSFSGTTMVRIWSALFLVAAVSLVACDSSGGGESDAAPDTPQVWDSHFADTLMDSEPAPDAPPTLDTLPDLTLETLEPDPDTGCGECEPGYQCDQGTCIPNCLLLCAGLSCGTAGLDGECACGTCGACAVCQAPACVDGMCLCEPAEDSCDDDDPCTITDGCVDGACTGLDEKDCDDGNDCTADSCEEGYCIHDQAAMQNVDCDDGNPCTGPDSCGAGVCTGPLLPPSEAPVEECLCLEDSDCAPLEDDDLCNGTLVCEIPEEAEGGNCQVDSDTIPDCDDGIDCTTDSCEPLTGCAHTPDHGLCGDGVDCTADVCGAVSGCGNLPDHTSCSDDISCTVDTCHPDDGCQHAPDDDVCSDDIPCTEDSCVLGEGCQFTPLDEACDDDIPCTTDSCDPGEGCQHIPVDGACEDDVDCTADTCVPGEGCVSTPQDGACDDDVGCTADACDPVDGCLHSSEDGLCDDDIACTADTCHPLEDCQHAPDDGLCGDGVDCTVDACQIGQGCTYQPDHVFCADGHACTVDACDTLEGCKYLTYDSLCDDDVGCTADSCQVGQGCVFAPDDGACNDDVGCTADSCHPQDGCVNAPQHTVCQDDNGCTSDTCSPTLGCTHAPQNDGEVCGDGSAICDGGLCLYNCDGAGQWEWINSKEIDGGHQVAQVIVPQADGYLQGAELLIWSTQTGGVLANLQVEVVSMSDGAPTGSVQISIILPSWMLSDTPADGMTFVLFNPAPVLTAGQPVALRISSPGTSGGPTAYHLGVSCEAFGMPDVYPPGTLFTNAGGGWSSEACDASFQLHVKQGIPCQGF